MVFYKKNYLFFFEEGNVENGGIEVDKLKQKYFEGEGIFLFCQCTVLF